MNTSILMESTVGLRVLHALNQEDIRHERKIKWLIVGNNEKVLIDFINALRLVIPESIGVYTASKPESFIKSLSSLENGYNRAVVAPISKVLTGVAIKSETNCGIVSLIQTPTSVDLSFF